MLNSYISLVATTLPTAGIEEGGGRQGKGRQWQGNNEKAQGMNYLPFIDVHTKLYASDSGDS